MKYKDIEFGEWFHDGNWEVRSRFSSIIKFKYDIVIMPCNSKFKVSFGKDFLNLDYLYYDIFGDDLLFSSIEEAKNHIDNFISNIDKYEKLQGFI